MRNALAIVAALSALAGCGRSMQLHDPPEIGAAAVGAPGENPAPQALPPPEGTPPAANLQPRNPPPPIGPTPSLQAARFDVPSGEGVTVQGTASYGSRLNGPVSGGQLFLDVLQVTGDSKFPALIHHQALQEWGPWSFEAPREIGEVGIVLFLDRNNDGPEPGEPTWNTPLEIRSEPVEGIAAVLDDNFRRPPPVGPDEPPTR